MRAFLSLCSFNGAAARCFLTAALAGYGVVHAAPPADAMDAATTHDRGRLLIEKKQLRLVDAAGRETDRLAVRAKHLDIRTHAADKTAGDLAVVLDADSGQPLALLVRDGRFSRLPALPRIDLSIRTLCLHRDRQGLHHLFVIGEDGRAEQWLLHETGHRLVRPLALPAAPGACKVDDGLGVLYVSEPTVGLWAYDIGLESAEGRRLIVQRQPAGKLRLPPSASSKRPAARELPIVMPRAQTDPVARFGDAADDPAIWVHPTHPAGSRVLGTNKKQGLLVYDLAGKQLQLLEVGRINNVDLRQGVRIGGETKDLVVATQRDEIALVMFSISADGVVAEEARLPIELTDPYGVCVGRTPAGELDVYVNDKDGRFLHLRIEKTAQQWTSRVLRRFKVATQPEGCVVDEAAERVFIGEEKKAVWVLSSREDQPATLREVIRAGRDVKADIEGLALYRSGDSAYLVVSSQGNDSFVVLDAAPPYKVRGAFRIGINVERGIDGVSETDGIEVQSKALGPGYPKGLLVVQDGHKRMPAGPQNFKYVSWEDVARTLGLP